MGYLPRKVTLPLRESSSSLVNTATRVFRERAATKQREFIGAAQTHVAKGAAMLSDAIEDKLEDVIDRVPGGSQVGHSSNRLCRRRSRQRSKLSCRGVRARLRVRAGCFWLESRWDSRIGQILIQPVGWAEASRNAKAIFARLGVTA